VTGFAVKPFFRVSATAGAGSCFVPSNFLIEFNSTGVEMAETEPVSVPDVLGVHNATNGTARIPATQEGMFIAYGSLVVMALLPIVLGAFRSVTHHKEQKVRKRMGHNISCKLQPVTMLLEQFLFV